MLHALKLPPEARWLRRIIAMQRVLLGALATPGLVRGTVTAPWIAALWRGVAAAWTTRFCGRAGFLTAGQDYVEHSPDAVRREIWNAFVRENRIARMLAAGGDFRGLETWQAAQPQGCDAVVRLLLPFYKAIYRENTGANPWPGYQFQRNGTTTKLSRVSYLDGFRTANPKVIVCPYCDGEMDSPKLDHFYPESRWHFFVCAPLNLVPVCDTCNGPEFKHTKVPLDPGPPYSAVDWLHPYLRTGAKRFTIRLVGDPPDPVPELEAVIVAEQKQFANAESILGLRRRWQKRLRSVFSDVKTHIRREAREARRQNRAPSPLDETLLEIGADADENAGAIPSALLRRAVCEAAIFDRADYRALLAA